MRYENSLQYVAILMFSLSVAAGFSVDQELSDKSQQAIDSGQLPQKVGGATTTQESTYILKKLDGTPAFIFKHGLRGQKESLNPVAVPLRTTIANEVLAYELDKEIFAGRYKVPKTVFLKINIPGDELCQPCVGSAQKFVRDTTGLTERHALALGNELFKKLPKTETDRLTFSLLVGNTDLHAGNILLQRENNIPKLVLIDHGYSFAQDREFHTKSIYHLAKSPGYLSGGNYNSEEPLSEDEKLFIDKLNIKEAMAFFRKASREMSIIDPKFKISPNRYLVEGLVLIVAKMAAQNNLSHWQWYDALSKRDFNSEQIQFWEIIRRAEKFNHEFELSAKADESMPSVYDLDDALLNEIMMLINPLTVNEKSEFEIDVKKEAELIKDMLDKLIASN